MSKQGLTKQQVIDWAKRHDYESDSYGHLQKTKGDDKYRLKLQATSVRLEKRLDLKPAEWLRIRSGYYKNLSITEEDKIRGLKP